MSDIRLDTFDRPARYWLRRAEKCKQAGDLRRAAALERHALRLDPENPAAAESYALTLRYLGCYEASNREGCAALARDPENAGLLGVLGQNLLSMGRRQEAYDAFTLFADQLGVEHPDAIPYDPDMETGGVSSAAPRRARGRGRLPQARKRHGRGDLAGAAWALERSEQPPFAAPNARREELWALLCHRRGDMQGTLAHIERSLMLRPNNAQTGAAAACLLYALGKRRRAAMVLLNAAMCAALPQEEMMVCVAADQLDLLPVALGMLDRSYKRRPDRLAVCYGRAVCLLELGRLSEAAQMVHRLRESDPDDVPGEVLFNRVMRMEEQALSPADVTAQSQALSFYGALSDPEIDQCLTPISECLTGGVDMLAAALLSDQKLRQRFRFLLALPTDLTAQLLPMVAAAMPVGEARCMLREALLCESPSETLKLTALALLPGTGAEPPYLCLKDGRLRYVDPSQPTPVTASFYQRMLTRRLNAAVRKTLTDASVPFFLRLVSRMDDPARMRMIADPNRVWPNAMSILWREAQGLAPEPADTAFLDSVQMRALSEALDILKPLLAQGGRSHADH